MSLRIVPEQQLQLSVQESNQRPPAHGLSVAVAERAAVVADAVRVHTLGPRGQRHDLRRPEVKACRRKVRKQRNKLENVISVKLLGVNALADATLLT